MRVIGVDPGVTRCGFAVVEVGEGRKLSVVEVGVVETDPQTPHEQRLLQIQQGLERVFEVAGFADPSQQVTVSIERPYLTEHNPDTAFGTVQVVGLAQVLAAQSGLPVQLSLPAQVKSAVTGSGRADKQQVARAVCRLLNLTELPKPVDATDALAIALVVALRGPSADAATPTSDPRAKLTPAQLLLQQATRDAKRKSRGRLDRM
jgi:crossover junction endodeoxyribonuclease RuvC